MDRQTDRHRETADTALVSSIVANLFRAQLDFTSRQNLAKISGVRQLNDGYFSGRRNLDSWTISSVVSTQFACMNDKRTDGYNVERCFTMRCGIKLKTVHRIHVCHSAHKIS